MSFAFLATLRIGNFLIYCGIFQRVILLTGFLLSVLGICVLTSAPIRAADKHTDNLMYDQVAGDGASGASVKAAGSHRHKTGNWMLSYRFMRLVKSGHRIGTDKVSPEYIVTNIINSVGQTLRVVPRKLTVDKHVFGAAFTLTDRVTLMAMIPYIRKKMNLITFRGARGAERLGTFTVRSQGFGDPQISARTRLYSDAMHRLDLSMGLRLPVGSIDKRGTALSPMNTPVRITLPYPMQIGSGSFGLLPGLIYSGNSGDISWKAQYTAAIQLNDNKRDYRLGDRHNLAVSGRIQAQDWLGFSLRARGWTQGRVRGRDRRIIAPVQAAEPNFLGGDHIDISFGADFKFLNGLLRGNRIDSQFILPVYQKLNGPQIANDWAFAIGLKRNF